MDVKLKFADWDRNTCSVKNLRVVTLVQLLWTPTSIASLEPAGHLLVARRLLCVTGNVISDDASAVDINEKQDKGVMPNSACVVKRKKYKFCQIVSKLFLVN